MVEKISSVGSCSSAFDLDICNDWGYIRRSKVKNRFYQGMIAIEDVVEIYRLWRDTPEFFILREDYEYEMGFEHQKYTGSRYHYGKCAKRGNDVYTYLIDKKLSKLDGLSPIHFFDPSHTALARSPMLFITLTYDVKRCSVVEAWEHIGIEFNAFMSALKHHYGDVVYFRAWESFGGENYYPHIHMVVYFKEHSFPIFRHESKKGKETFRIPNADKEKISSMWHSHVDIQAVSDTLRAFHEVKKYCVKEIFTPKGDKTNAMCWLFGKQQYSISRDFIKTVWGKECDISPPEVGDLVKPIMSNSKSTFTFIGILGAKELKIQPDLWYYCTDKPPPSVIEYMILEWERRNALKMRRM